MTEEPALAWLLPPRPAAAAEPLPPKPEYEADAEIAQSVARLTASSRPRWLSFDVLLALASYLYQPPRIAWQNTWLPNERMKNSAAARRCAGGSAGIASSPRSPLSAASLKAS